MPMHGPPEAFSRADDTLARAERIRMQVRINELLSLRLNHTLLPRGEAGELVLASVGNVFVRHMQTDQFVPQLRRLGR